MSSKKNSHRLGGLYPRSASLDSGLTKTSKKSVTFSSNTVTWPCRGQQESVHNLWYTSNDLQSFRDDIKHTLNELSRVNGNIADLDQDKYCLRGLEEIQRKRNNKKVKERVKNTIQSVLEMQRHQRLMGILDPKGIQVFACACSRKAREQALLLAKIDRKIEASSTFEFNEKKEEQGRRTPRREESKVWNSNNKGGVIWKQVSSAKSA